VIIHEGQSSESGHYFTFSKTNQNTWLELNDERVTEVNSDRVLDNKNAYVLFYKLEKVL
jgi:ubiquitin C-terminal hydrolase